MNGEETAKSLPRRANHGISDITRCETPLHFLSLVGIVRRPRFLRAHDDFTRPLPLASGFPD